MTITEQLEALQKIVDAMMIFFAGKCRVKKGEMSASEFARNHRLVWNCFIPNESPHAAACSTDWPNQAFNEQLQRVAQQLSATIEGLPLGNHYAVLDHYSKSWCCFLGVYKDLIKMTTRWLSLTEDASCAAALKAAKQSRYGRASSDHLLVANRDTDYRVLGMKVFHDRIGCKYHKQMCDAVSHVIKDCCERGKDLRQHYSSISSCLESTIATVDVERCLVGLNADMFANGSTRGSLRIKPHEIPGRLQGNYRQLLGCIEEALATSSLSFVKLSTAVAFMSARSMHRPEFRVALSLHFPRCVVPRSILRVGACRERIAQKLATVAACKLSTAEMFRQTRLVERILRRVYSSFHRVVTHAAPDKAAFDSMRAALQISKGDAGRALPVVFGGAAGYYFFGGDPTEFSNENPNPWLGHTRPEGGAGGNASNVASDSSHVA